MGLPSSFCRAPTPWLTLPTIAWQFSDSTPRIAAEGMLQGAALVHGRGRVAMFGEAAMVSAALAHSLAQLQVKRRQRK